MLCKRCEREIHRAGGGSSIPGRSRRESSESVTQMLCDRCGSVLPLIDADGYMLRRLEQLARFGIGAGSGPLLATSPEADR